MQPPRRPAGWFTLSAVAPGADDFESALLGELFDRRQGSVGFALTQPLKAAGLDLRLLNRLSASGGCAAPAGEVRSFAGALSATLEHAPQRFYWFRNAGAAPAADERRVDAVDLGRMSLSAGFDFCALSDFDATAHVERDLRGEAAIEAPEGDIAIASETAAQRYRPDLERLVAQLGTVGDETAVDLQLRPRRKPPEADARGPKSFTRARLARRVPSLRQASEDVLGPLLSARGFRPVTPNRTGDGLWVRDADERFHHVRAQLGRAGYDVRLLLAISESVEPLERVVRSAELLARGASLPYADAAELVARLQAFGAVLQSAGFDWFRATNALDTDAWRERGLLDSEAPASSAKKPRLP